MPCSTLASINMASSSRTSLGVSSHKACGPCHSGPPRGCGTPATCSVLIQQRQSRRGLVALRVGGFSFHCSLLFCAASMTSWKACGAEWLMSSFLRLLPCRTFSGDTRGRERQHLLQRQPSTSPHSPSLPSSSCVSGSRMARAGERR